MAVLEAFINPSTANVENQEIANKIRAGMISTIFGCWHRNLGRPFTRNGETYRPCLSCGARRQFNLGTWKLNGPYYYGPTSPNDLKPKSSVRSSTSGDPGWLRTQPETTIFWS